MIQGSKVIKNVWCILLLLFISGQGVPADNKTLNDPNEAPAAKWDIAIHDPGDPNELLRAKWNSVVNVLRTKELDPKVKANVIDKIVNPMFDFPLMAKLALGRTNWPKLNTSQREKFISLFVQRLKTTYRDKIMLYEDEKVLFQPAVQNKDTIHIPMAMVSDDKKLVMLYKFHKANESWKIYDVEIEGVSILLTYRSQFDDSLSHGTVDDLLSQLEKPAGS